MNVSIFLARTLGVFLVVVYFSIYFHHKRAKAIMEEMANNKSAVLITSIMSLTIGTLILIAHPLFTADWRCLITLIGLLSFLKGFMLLYFPTQVTKFKGGILSITPVYFGFVTIFLLVGIFLLYHGFWA